jgi:twinkle protein
MPGMFTVISGITNFGKSELMDEVVRCMIEQHGWKFAFYSPENFPLPLHMIKIAEKRIGKPFDTEKRGHMSQDEAVEAADWMQEHIWYINPRNQTYSIDEILERAQALVYREGINGLIIDPWNYVRKDFGGLREDQYINECMQRIGVFCKRTNVHVWLIVHPRTLRRDKNDKIQVPNVMDLSGGSKFGDNCDFFVVVHRDPIEAAETGIHKVTVYCQKSRYRYAAVQGMVDLEWCPLNGRFAALGEVEAEPGVEILGVKADYTWRGSDDELLTF